MKLRKSCTVGLLFIGMLADTLLLLLQIILECLIQLLFVLSLLPAVLAYWLEPQLVSSLYTPLLSKDATLKEHLGNISMSWIQQLKSSWSAILFQHQAWKVLWTYLR